MSLFKAPEMWDLTGEWPVYMVFKYIPDAVRMEPKNIGVMLWKKGALVAKFLPKTPKFISGSGIIEADSLYAQWINYWSTELAKTEIVSASKGGTPVHVSSVQYLQVLMDGNKPNFCVVLGGEVHSKIDNVTDHIEELYQRIVV